MGNVDRHAVLFVAVLLSAFPGWSFAGTETAAGAAVAVSTFDQLKKGDRISAVYTEAVAIPFRLPAAKK